MTTPSSLLFQTFPHFHLNKAETWPGSTFFFCGMHYLRLNLKQDWFLLSLAILVWKYSLFLLPMLKLSKSRFRNYNLHRDLLPLTSEGNWEASNVCGTRGTKDRIGIGNGPENFIPALHSVSTQMARERISIQQWGKGLSKCRRHVIFPEGVIAWKGLGSRFLEATKRPEILATGNIPALVSSWHCTRGLYGTLINVAL